MEAASVNRNVENLTPESGGFARVSGELHQISAAIGELKGITQGLARRVEKVDEDLGNIRTSITHLQASIAELKSLPDRVKSLETRVEELNKLKFKIIGAAGALGFVATFVMSWLAKLVPFLGKIFPP